MKMIEMSVLNKGEMTSIVEHEILNQAMEQTVYGFGDLQIKGIALKNRVKRVRRNCQQLDAASREYVVAKAKFAELNTYLGRVRECTINNDAWREETLAGAGDINAVVQLVETYDVDAEFARLFED